MHVPEQKYAQLYTKYFEVKQTISELQPVYSTLMNLLLMHTDKSDLECIEVDLGTLRHIMYKLGELREN
jgi:hypothetical protein